MNVKQKLGYMFIGCLFTIAGYILASLGGDTTHAQQREQVIDKIVCRELQIVNKDGLLLAEISERPINGGGWLRINNKKGILGAGMHTDVFGGSLNVYDPNGRQQASLSSGFFGSILFTDHIEIRNKTGSTVVVINDQGVVVHNEAGKPVASISINEGHGGFIDINNEAGKKVVTITTTQIEGGFIGINNEAGKRVVTITTTDMGNGTIKTYNGGWRRH